MKQGAIAVLTIILALLLCSFPPHASADGAFTVINGDGEIRSSDAILMLRKVAGLN